MSMRDEFERIYKSVHKGHKLDRDPVGTYVNMAAQVAWEFWQAARAQGEPNDDMDYPDFCVISFGHAGYPLKHEVFVDVEEASIRANELDAKGFSIVKRQSTYTHPPSGANQGGVPEEVVSLVREAESACQDDGEQTLRESRLAQRWLDSLNQAVNLLTTSPNKPEQEWVPEGWKLVPIESTSEMDIAGMDSLHNSYEGYPIERDDAETIWMAMLDEAPQPPQEQREASDE